MNPILRWLEPWYLVYGLVASVSVALVPILLPQFVAMKGHPSEVGMVMAVFNLGSLTAPVWGYLAERRWHRPLVLWGITAMGITLVLFPSSHGLGEWLFLSFWLGTGFGAVATISTLLVVERHPKKEWDSRLGWLQTVFGVGQVLGLLLAVPFSGTKSSNGCYASAILMALSFPLAFWLIRTPAAPPVPLHAAPRGTFFPHVTASPAATYHHLGKVSWDKVASALTSPFGMLLIVYGGSVFASSLIFTAYPLLFSEVFDVSPRVSSLGFGIAAALAIGGYPFAGFLSKARSPLAVMSVSLIARTVVLVFLTVLTAEMVYVKDWLALIGFGLIVNSWPFISVCGTVLAASLAPVDEGTSMGLFNATFALASTIGALATGWVAFHFGYERLPLFAFLIAIPSLAMLVPLWRRRSFEAQENHRWS